MAKIYTSTIKSDKGNTIRVDIYKDSSSASQATELSLDADMPVRIEYNCDDLFQPLKTSTCSVSVITDEPLLSLYTGKLTEVQAYVYRNNTLIWFGYLSPNIYQMDYDGRNDKLVLEFVDPLRAMESAHIEEKANGQWRSFSDTINDALSAVNATGVITSVDKSLASKLSSIDLTKVGCMERNYIDETGEADNAMTCNEVLQHICLYLGVQAMCYGNLLYLVDTLQSQTTAVFSSAANDIQLSLGSVYNRATVIESTNPIGEILDQNILDDKVQDSMMLASHSMYDKDLKCYNVQCDGGKVTDLRAMYKPKADSGWQLINTDLVYSPIDHAGTAEMAHTTMHKADANYTKVEKGAFILYDTNYENSKTPSRLTFNKSLQLYCDRARTYHDPVEASVCPQSIISTLEYYNDLQDLMMLRYNKQNHSIVIKGGYIVVSMKYRYRRAPITAYEEACSNVNQSVSNFVSSYNRTEQYIVKSSRRLSYEDKFKAKLKIGNKYWNGSAWTTTESTFYLAHTWQGSDMLLGTDASLDNTNTYRLRTNEDVEGLAIPVGSDALFGNILFELYPPSYMGKNWAIEYYDLDPYSVPSWGMDDCSPCACIISEMKLTYCVGDKSIEVLDLETEDSDIKVTGTIDADNIEELDDVEMRINTWSDRQQSYSYVINRDSSGNMSFRIPSPTPEESAVTRMVNHYKEPRLQFSGTVNDTDLKPYYRMNVPAFSSRGNMAILGITYDLYKDEAEVQLIETGQ